MPEYRSSSWRPPNGPRHAFTPPTPRPELADVAHEAEHQPYGLFAPAGHVWLAVGAIVAALGLLLGLYLVLR